MAIVIAESENAARELCAGARTLDNDVALIVFEEKNIIPNIADITYHINLSTMDMVEDAFSVVLDICKERSAKHILIEPTRRLKVIAGKLAHAFNTSVLTDVKGFEDNVASSLYYGGIAIRKQKIPANIAIYTCSPSAFGDTEPSGTDLVEERVLGETDQRVILKSRDSLPDPEGNLAEAKHVIAAGRGFAEKEELQLARELASLLGGELGCTRPLTEVENWIPKEYYIGISGLMLNPDLYVGLGVSGQMQHMVGVNNAKIAFAINKDKNAPIFNQVDYGLIGELTTLLPLVIENLK